MATTFQDIVKGYQEGLESYEKRQQKQRLSDLTQQYIQTQDPAALSQITALDPQKGAALATVQKQFQHEKSISDYLQSPTPQTLSQIALTNPQAANSIIAVNKMQQTSQARKVRALHNTWQRVPISQRPNLYQKWREDNQEDMDDYPIEYSEQTASEIDSLFDQDNEEARLILGEKPEKPLSKQGKLGYDVERGFATPEALNLAQREKLDKRGEVIFKQETKLRTEFLAQSKDFTKIQDAYNRILSSNPAQVGEMAKVSGQSQFGASDLALIFNYMKILDPNSVVRESEFATAENSRELIDQYGVPTSIIRWRDKILAGARLTPTQRADFVNQAGNLFKSKTQSHKKLKSEFSRIATNKGLDPANVIIEFEELYDPSQSQQTPQSSKPSGDVNGIKWRVK